MLDTGDVIVGLTTFSIVYIIVALFRRDGQNKDDRRRPPSMPALPIIGSFPFFRGGIEEMPHFFMEKAAILGPVFHFYAGNKLAVVLNDRNSIFDAMQRHSEAFADRDDFWTESNIFNVNLKGIAFSHYHERFKRNHKLILSSMKEFGFGANKETEIRICEEAEVMLREIHERNGRPFYPKFTFLMATGSMTLKMLFGRQAMSLINPREIIRMGNEFMGYLEPKINNAPVIRFLPKYRKMIAKMEVCHARLLELLQEALDHGNSDDSESNYVKRFLESEGPDYDHENLLYNLRDLILGSVDTVSSTIQWTIIELANQLDIQARLQKEIDEVIPTSRLPALTDKPNLPYTEAVLLEAMRRHTVLPFAIPHRTSRDTEVCGFRIPSGCLVLPNLYAAHMDPKVWTDPENFRPERFLDKDNKVIGKEMVIPFGLGKRACIGEILGRQEVFLLFTSLVQHFEFRPPQGQDSLTVKEEGAISVRPVPYEVRMIPRKY